MRSGIRRSLRGNNSKGKPSPISHVSQTTWKQENPKPRIPRDLILWENGITDRLLFHTTRNTNKTKQNNPKTLFFLDTVRTKGPKGPAAPDESSGPLWLVVRESRCAAPLCPGYPGFDLTTGLPVWTSTALWRPSGSHKVINDSALQRPDRPAGDQRRPKYRLCAMDQELELVGGQWERSLW